MHGRFSIIGGTCPGCPPSLRLCAQMNANRDYSVHSPEEGSLVPLNSNSMTAFGWLYGTEQGITATFPSRNFSSTTVWAPWKGLMAENTEQDLQNHFHTSISLAQTRPVLFLWLVQQPGMDF